MRTCEYLGEEDVQGARCVKLRTVGRLAWAVPADQLHMPGDMQTFWLARSLGFAPARVEHIYWWAYKGSQTLVAKLWIGGDYREAAPGLWLPLRVQVQESRGPKGERPGWSRIHVMEYFGLGVNQLVEPGDFAFVAPPEGQPPRRSQGRAAPEGVRPMAVREGHAEAWARAAQWNREPPKVEPDAAFDARVRDYARQGPPPMPAQSDPAQGGGKP